MATVSILPHGQYSGNRGNNPNPDKRKNSTGWSPSTSRRHQKWLFSIDYAIEKDYGLAFTFTVRDCPDHSESWASLRDTFAKRLFRMGAIRLHWLTEWQARGVPHLHGSVYFEKYDRQETKVLNHWLELGAHFGAEPQSQDIKVIENIEQWHKYVAKHSARGFQHYQRSQHNMPKGWEKSGRVWGYRGDWNTRPEIKVFIPQQTYYKYRRLIKSYRLSVRRDEMLQSKRNQKGSLFDQKKRLFTSARKMLKCPDLARSSIRGTNEWVDQSICIRFINYLIEITELQDQPQYDREFIDYFDIEPDLMPLTPIDNNPNRGFDYAHDGNKFLNLQTGEIIDHMSKF